MLVSPFQCDLCWFRNLTGRDPDPKRMRDDSLLIYIRKANLDILWGTSPGVVNSTRYNVKKGIAM